MGNLFARFRKQKMASVKCNCGAVKINFASPKTLWRLECCCYNCTHALEYAKKNGAAPVAGLDLQCIDSVWFQNDFTVEKGMDKIGAWLCFEGADTTRFYCKDCWTCVLADHPAYNGLLCVTQAVANVSGADLMDKQARHFMKDLSADQLAALDKANPWKGDPASAYNGVAENFIGSLEEIYAKGSTGEQMNLQKLLEKCGPAMIPKDDPSLAAGPMTLVQQGAKAAEEAAAAN